MAHATKAPTLEALRAQREDILRVAAAHGASNVRIFGSVARGNADQLSDVDVLVDFDDGAHGFAYFGRIGNLRQALAELLDIPVDVVDSAALRRMRDRVLAEAVAL